MNTIDSEILDLKKELLKMFFLVESQWEKGATAARKPSQDDGGPAVVPYFLNT